jgi:Neuraminidase (sialidase)
VVYVGKTSIVAAIGYKMYRSDDNGKTWVYWTSIKDKRKIIAKDKIFARLFRIEIAE